MMNSDDNIFSLLKQRYPAPKYSFCFEVPDGTSNMKCRSCDAIAIGCWLSVGVQMIGHEIKHSRSDWMKELQDPSKAEGWKQYCNFWYVVAPRGIVKLEELPSSWGLMEPAGGGLKVRKAAEIDRNPKPLTLNLVAAITRRFQTCSPSEDVLKKEYRRGHIDGVGAEKRIKTSDQRRVDSMRDDLARVKKEIADFEQKTGIRISGWYADDKAVESFKLLQRLSTSSANSRLGETARLLADAIDAFESARSKLEEAG